MTLPTTDNSLAEETQRLDLPDRIEHSLMWFDAMSCQYFRIENDPMAEIEQGKIVLDDIVAELARAFGYIGPSIWPDSNADPIAFLMDGKAFLAMAGTHMRSMPIEQVYARLSTIH